MTRNHVLAFLCSAGFTISGWLLPQKLTAQSSKGLASTKLAYEPLTIHDDFETGELFGWEPYPYQQDIGYDPLFFTRKEPHSADEKVSLCRSVRANDVVEVYHGFTKRFQILTDVNSRVSTKLYFQSDRMLSELTISLLAADGKKYSKTYSNLEVNNWLDVDLPIDSFRYKNNVLGNNIWIDGIVIVGRYDQVYYLNTYHILMDHFSMSGRQNKKLDWGSGMAEQLEHFQKTVARRLWRQGEIIKLSESFKSENLAGLKIMPARYSQNRQSYELKLAKGATEIVLPQNLGAGEWYLKALVRNKSRGQFADSIHFLVLQEMDAQHPRLFFDVGEWEQRLNGRQTKAEEQIRKKILSDTAFFKIVPEAIQEGLDYTAESYTGGPWSKYYVGLESASKWRGPLTRLSRLVHDAAIYYAFTKNERAADLARRAMLQLCRFSKWNNSFMLGKQFWTYFPMTIAIRYVAYGYDLIYDQLTDEERLLIRTTLVERGLRPFYRDMVQMNRMPSSLSNHTAITAAACGMAALAILRDGDPKDEVSLILHGIITRLSIFIERTYYEDGSYGETYDYMDMASREIVDFMYSLERLFGIDLTSRSSFAQCYKYPLQATYTTGMIQNYGDSYRLNKGFTQAHSIWLVKKMGNPYLFPFVEANALKGEGGFFGYLWYRGDIKPQSREELPLSASFKARGMVMRSNWEDSGTIITTRVGPHGNHMHFDQGSFQVMTNGEELLTDPSVSENGYYKDLEYVAYNIQAIGHNVITIDHDSESQLPADFDTGIPALSEWPRVLTKFNGTQFDHIQSELSSVYKNKLRSYQRSLLYRKSGLLFCIDELEPFPDTSHIYNLHFHVPYKAAGTLSGSTIRNQPFHIKGGKAEMYLQVFGSLEKISLRSRESGKNAETILSVHTKPVGSTRLVSVMYPKVLGSDNKFQVSELRTGDWQEIRVVTSEGVEQLYLRDSIGRSDLGEIVTDAKILYRSDLKNGVHYLFTGTHFETADWKLELSKTAVVSIAPGSAPGDWILETNSDETLMVRLTGKGGQRWALAEAVVAGAKSRGKAPRSQLEWRTHSGQHKFLLKKSH